MFGQPAEHPINFGCLMNQKMNMQNLITPVMDLKKLGKYLRTVVAIYDLTIGK